MRLFLGAVVLLVGSLVSAADWPQWRGPDRSGVSQEKGLLKTWPEKGPTLAWSFKNAGLGFSSIAVVGGKVYTLGTRDKDEVVLALDAVKGTELWTAVIGPIFTFEGNVWGDGPRGTPTIDGDRLYAIGGQGDLVCLDITANGKEVWRKSLLKDLDGEMMSEWGYSESPLIDGDVLICTPGGAKGTLAALDKKTGGVLWRSTELKNNAPYSSVIVAEIQGVRQYIQTSYISETEGGVVSGFAAKDGKVLWTEPIFKGHSYAIANTCIAPGDSVYVTSGYGGGCHRFEIGPGQKAKDAYSKAKQKAVKCTHGGVLLIDGAIYGHTEPGSWVCQDFQTGNVNWSERNTVECRSGAITAAEGLLYLYSDEGEVGLASVDAKEFKLVSSFKLPEASKYPETRPSSKQAKVWPHPVVANGHLFLRDAELIFCYDIRDKK